MSARESVGEPSNSLAEIANLQSQFEIFRFLRRVGGLFGFRHFLVLKLPDSTSLNLNDNSIITNWPAEFLGAFDRMGLLKSSPLILKLRRSVTPFVFEFSWVASEREGEVAEQAERLYAEFGFRRGACIPVHDEKGQRSAVILCGDRESLCDTQLAELTLIAIHAFQRLMDVTGTEPRQEQRLTEREIDCLSWTAAGKTSADIAQILSLSEHTVNHYLNRAARKLDTVNRTQAVAKALRSGLIA